MALSTETLHAFTSASVAPTSSPQPLPGGMGQSLHWGDIVLKPAGSSLEAEWASQVFEDLAKQRFVSFHVPIPIRSSDDTFVKDGWIASKFIPDMVQISSSSPAAQSFSVDKIILASRAFHQAINRLPQPEFLAHRNTPWAIADRVAWDGKPFPVDANLRVLLDRLLDMWVPVSIEGESWHPQIIHGDLAGNIFLSSNNTDLPPVIIDFSPLYRPVPYAEAIVFVDGILWYGLTFNNIEPYLDGQQGLQMLVRATIFRLVAESELVKTHQLNSGYSNFTPLVDWIFTRISK